MNEAQGSVTPLMKQYLAIKEQFADAIVLFQVGDFYEIFLQDAQVVAQFLGITLTKRGTMQGQPIPLCGFPVHTADHYIAKLVKGGFKVAICDQTEPATAGKMVARAVTQVLTAGTLIADNLLDSKTNSYLFSFFPTSSGLGLLFSELACMQLHATIVPVDAFKQLETELFRFLPDEILLHAHKTMHQYDTFFKERGFVTTLYDVDLNQDCVTQETDWLKAKLNAESFQLLQEHNALLYATILWKKYMQRNQQTSLQALDAIQFYQPENFLMLDGATQKNLELFKNSFDQSRSHTLFSLMDRAETAMGSRMIRRWIASPLLDRQVIEDRQSVVGFFVKHHNFLNAIAMLLRGCCDMERIVGRIALRKAARSDYLMLMKVLKMMPDLHMILRDAAQPFLQSIAPLFSQFETLQLYLSSACNDDLCSSDLIKPGFDQNLDYIKDLVKTSSQKILKLEQEEIARTGIQSLKIRHNNIAGYYIEITNTHSDAIPDDFIQNATLSNRKRFTTPRLQALQFEIFQAEQQQTVLEKELFEKVKNEVREHVASLRLASFAIAQMDALLGFAQVAYNYQWICPQLHDGSDIIIQEGKHPVIAAMPHIHFIANDLILTDTSSLLIITGPNMGGKSTYLRQAALITILAQAGSFVPAKKAELAMVDRIFTRIGAGDFLAQGKSTFLVEMEETAYILRQATSRSLIILDEVGRGTSTYDGLALAQAIIEYILKNIKARSLFATHYHELVALADQHENVVSLYADSIRLPTGIVFLHKMVQGKADGSFGLEVARLAHMPVSVVARAGEILQNLHQANNTNNFENFSSALNDDTKHFVQLDKHESLMRKKIAEIDFDLLSAKQAYDLLWQLKDYIK